MAKLSSRFIYAQNTVLLCNLQFTTTSRKAAEKMREIKNVASHNDGKSG